jgi:hypothetical protein
MIFLEELFKSVFTALVEIRVAKDVGKIDDCLTSAIYICSSLIFVNALSISYLLTGYYRGIPFISVPFAFFYFMVLSEKKPSYYLNNKGGGILKKLIVPYIILSLAAMFLSWKYLR